MSGKNIAIGVIVLYLLSRYKGSTASSKYNVSAGKGALIDFLANPNDDLATLNADPTLQIPYLPLQ